MPGANPQGDADSDTWSTPERPSVGGSGVHRHDASTVQAQVVGEREPGSLDLAPFGKTAQLSGELDTLGQTGGTERMALGDQSAQRIDDPLPVVRRRTRLAQRPPRPRHTGQTPCRSGSR